MAENNLYYLLDVERTVTHTNGIAHYWKANRHGYVTDIRDREIGLFDESVAKRICDEDFDKRTVMIPERVVERILEMP